MTSAAEAVVEQPWLMVGTMAVALLINSAIAWYKGKVGKEENSPSLMADARNTPGPTQSLTWPSMVGVTLEMLGVPRMDAVTGLVVVAFLVKTGSERGSGRDARCCWTPQWNARCWTR